MVEPVLVVQDLVNTRLRSFLPRLKNVLSHGGYLHPRMILALTRTKVQRCGWPKLRVVCRESNGVCSDLVFEIVVVEDVRSAAQHAEANLVEAGIARWEGIVRQHHCFMRPAVAAIV